VVHGAPLRVDRFNESSRRERHRLARWSRLALADALGGVVMVRHVLAHPRRYPLAVIGFPVYWAGDILALWAACRRSTPTIALAPLVLAYTTAYVAPRCRCPRECAGGVEAGLTFALQSVRRGARASALLATLVYASSHAWLPIGVAALA
jgi:hypothetical protein